jgi:hypothetical protein
LERRNEKQRKEKKYRKGIGVKPQNREKEKYRKGFKEVFGTQKYKHRN